MDLLCTHCGAVVLAHRPEQPTGEEIAVAIAAHEAACHPVPGQRAPDMTSAPGPVPDNGQVYA